MNRVGTRSRHDVHYRAGQPSELSIEIAGEEMEFLHRIGIRRLIAAVAKQRIVRRAIEKKNCCPERDCRSRSYCLRRYFLLTKY